MSNEKINQRQILHLVTLLADAPLNLRDSVLELCCPDDPGAREKIHRLLRFHDEADENRFLETSLLARKDEDDEVESDFCVDGNPTVEPASEGTRFSPLPDQVEKSGGMGVVQKVCDRQFGRLVALKKIREDKIDNQSLRARFEREALITGRLDHPGVPPVYSYGYDIHGNPYYCMKYLDGQTLTAAVEEGFSSSKSAHSASSNDKKSEMLQLRSLLNSFVHVCQTIAYAHHHGVLHRDIKPDNIVLDEFGGTFVLDWGLAKLIDEREAAALVEDKNIREIIGESLTGFGTMMGTEGFRSPEQFKEPSEEIGCKGDIYALGATLFFILTGRIPSTHPSESEIHREIGKTLGRQGRSLAAICSTAMAEQSAERYGAADEMATDVQAFLDDEPVSTYHEPYYDRLGRWARRNRRLVVAGLAGLVAICVVSAIAAFLLNRARMDERRERNQKLQVVDFMVDAFDVTEGDQIDGGAIRLFDALKRVQKRAETMLADQPQVKADVLETVGRSFLSMGRPSDAIDPLEGSIQLKESDAGESLVTVASSFELAKAYRLTGRLEDAILLHRDIDRRIQLHGQSDARLESEVQANLAAAQFEYGNYDTAIPLLKTTIDRIAQNSTFALNKSKNSWLTDLGRAYIQTGKVDEAIKSLRLARDEIRPSSDVTEKTRTTIYLADCYRQKGRVDEAVSLLREMIREISLRDDVKDTKESLLAELEEAISNAGRVEDTLQLKKELLKVQQVVGADHEKELSRISELAWSYHENGNVSEAKKFFDLFFKRLDEIDGSREGDFRVEIDEPTESQVQIANKVLPILQKTLHKTLQEFGEEAPQTMGIREQLANVLLRLGNTGEAERNIKSVLNSVRKKYGDDYPNALNLMSKLAFIYLQDGRSKDAILILEDAIKFTAEANLPVPKITLVSRLSNALAADGQIDACIEQGERALRLVSQLENADPTLELSVKNQLAVAYGNKIESVQKSLGLGNSQNAMEAKKTLNELHATRLNYIKECVSRANQHFGPLDERSLLSELNLARMHKESNQNETATKIFENLLPRFRNVFGEGNRETLLLGSELGELYRENGSYELALHLAEKSYSDAQEHLGKSDPLTDSLKINLAITLSTVGRTHRAIELYESSLKFRESYYGQDDEKTLQVLNAFSATLYRAKQFEKAEKLLRKLVPRLEVKHGKRSPDTLVSINSLASVLSALKRSKEAIAQLEELLARSDGLLPVETQIKMQNNLGYLYWEDRQPSRAVETLEKALTRAESELKINHPDRLRLMLNLGRFYRNLKRIDESIQLLKTSLRIHQDSGRSDHPETLEVAANLAASYRLGGQFLEATEVLGQNLPRALAALGEDHATTKSMQKVQLQIKTSDAEATSSPSSPNSSP